MKSQNKTSKQGRLSRFFSIFSTAIFLILGLFLLLYPTVADYINFKMNDDAIDEYRRQVDVLSEADYTELLNAAKAYNEDLFRNTPFIGELTEKKRREYESLLDVTGTGVIGYVKIDKINVYLAIYHGTSDDVLQKATGHVEGSSLPIEGENVHSVISGHCGLPSARLFTDVDQLEIGDTFSVHVLNEVMTYQVENIEKVLPETLKSMRIEEDRDLCTLMTCTPYSVNSHRLVVTGRRIETPKTETPSSNAGSSNINHVAAKWDNSQLIVPIIIIAAIIPTSALTALLITWIRRKRLHK